MVKRILVITALYAATRLPFLVFQPVYFDSFEYIAKLQTVTWSTIIPTIRLTHQPVHTAFIGIASMVRLLTNFPPEAVYTLLSLGFGLITVFLWHAALFRMYKNSTQALWGSVIFLLFPGFWRASTNILYETMLLAFQAATMLSLLLFFDTNRLRYIIGAIGFFAIAQLVFVGNLFIAVPVAVLTYHPQRKKWTVVWLAVSVALSLLIDRILLGSTNVVIQKYTSHTADVISPQGGIVILMARMLRNIIVISSKLIHPLSALLTVVTLWTIRKDKKLVLTAATFLAISFGMMQYFHGGFTGRIGMLIVFPVSLLLGNFFAEKPIAGFIACTVFIINIFQLGIIQNRLPYIQALIAWKQSTLSRNPHTAIITSGFEYFIFDETTNLFIVRDPEHEQSKLAAFIDSAQKHGNRVFIDTAALTYPYNQPDGWEYQLLSRQNKQGFLMKFLSDRCLLQKVMTEKSIPQLGIYEVKNCVIIDIWQK